MRCRCERGARNNGRCSGYLDGMRSRVRGWRRRPNELRRRSDVVETWTLLGVGLLLFVAAPLVGVVAAWWAHGDAHATAEKQRAEQIGRAHV